MNIPGRYPMPLDRVDRFCICGGAVTGTASPENLAQVIVLSFDLFHSGEGHGPATRQQAAAARRREQRKAVGRDLR